MTTYIPLLKLVLHAIPSQAGFVHTLNSGFTHAPEKNIHKLVKFFTQTTLSKTYRWLVNLCYSA